MGNSDVIELSDILSKSSQLLKKIHRIPEGAKFLLSNNKKKALSIGARIEYNAKKYPNNMAILYEEEHYTYREYNEWVNSYANYFLSLGLQKGDTVAIFMENRPEILVAVAAVVKVGAIAGLVNTAQRHHVLEHSMNLIKPKLYIIGEELIDAFEEVHDNVNTSDSHLLFVPDKKQNKKPDSFQNLETAASLFPISNPFTTKRVLLGDPCFYIFTSGTTGLPKASIMTHLRWFKAYAGFGILALNMTPDDCMYVSLPFYHNNALTVSWSSVISGASTLAIRRKFSASQFWEDARKFNATAFCYIGELCRYLLNQPPQPNDLDNKINKIVGNGLRPDIWDQFKERFGIEYVYEFYAASESNQGFVNLLNFDKTVGLCPGKYEIVKYDIEEDQPIRDENGFMIPVEKGESGLLVIEVSDKAPYDGYTDKEASEKKLFHDVFTTGDTWFNSGDLMMDMGFKHSRFVDRLGDTFRWKGENVSTGEVEGVINLAEDIAECTVYGVEIPETDGRAGMASIISKVETDQLNLKKLSRILWDELPAYAIPIFLRIQPEMEITGTFKHKKTTLKKEGFNPDEVTDPLFYLPPRKNEYEPLTSEEFEKIESGEIKY